MTTETKSAMPGERWRVNLEPIDETSDPNPWQGIVKLVDYDARTNVWNVEPEDQGAPAEVSGDSLIERVSDVRV